MRLRLSEDQIPHPNDWPMVMQELIESLRSDADGTFYIADHEGLALAHARAQVLLSWLVVEKRKGGKE